MICMYPCFFTLPIFTLPIIIFCCDCQVFESRGRTKFYKISLSVSWNIVCCYLLISGLLPCWQNSTRERTWSILKSEEKHNEVSCSQSSQKILSTKSTSIWMSQECERPRMSNKKVIKKWPSIQIFQPLPFCVCVSKSSKMDTDWL